MTLADAAIRRMRPIAVVVVASSLLVLALGACKTVIRPPQTIYDTTWDYPGGGGI